MVKMHLRGDKHFVTIGPNLLESGWFGGQWVKYVGKRTVEKATDHVYAGFLLIGHKLNDLDSKPYNYLEGGVISVPFKYENIALDAYGQSVMITDSGEMDFNLNVYDTTQVYTYNQTLYINNNGFLTNVNVGGPSVGIVSVTPQDNNGWLGITLKY